MDRDERAGSYAMLAMALLVALLVAPLLRNAVADVKGSLGQVWPLTSASCHAPTTPGCPASERDRLTSTRHAPTR